jgi:mono/diheme cytochrome c family protein
MSLAKTIVTGLAGAVTALVVLALVGLIVVYSGMYNVAATEEHSSIVRWLFDTTFHTSIERNAEGIEAPETLTPEMVAAGAAGYKTMCQHCHAGPGVERAKWASGMRPRPPHLTEAARKWEPAEVYWLVKHGAKMTGMPAFGPSHSEAELWNIAVFVAQLPAMTPEHYAKLGEGGHSHADAHSHGPSGGGNAEQANSPPR